MIDAAITKHTEGKIERKEKTNQYLSLSRGWTGGQLLRVRRAPGNLIARDCYFEFPGPPLKIHFTSFNCKTR